MYGHSYNSISDLYIIGVMLIVLGIANLLGYGRTPGTYKSYSYAVRYRRRNGLIRLISGILLIPICIISEKIGDTVAVILLVLLVIIVIVLTLINEKSIR